jgi:hypothetical protein
MCHISVTTGICRNCMVVQNKEQRITCPRTGDDTSKVCQSAKFDAKSFLYECPECCNESIQRRSKEYRRASDKASALKEQAAMYPKNRDLKSDYKKADAEEGTKEKALKTASTRHSICTKQRIKSGFFPEDEKRAARHKNEEPEPQDGEYDEEE